MRGVSGVCKDRGMRGVCAKGVCEGCECMRGVAGKGFVLRLCVSGCLLGLGCVGVYKESGVSGSSERRVVHM